MKFFILSLLFPIFLFTCLTAVRAEEKIISVSFDTPNKKAIMGYTLFTVNETVIENKVGMPSLPFRIVHLVFDKKIKVEKVALIAKQRQIIKEARLVGNYKIFPGQNPCILCQQNPCFVKEDTAFYNSLLPYPEKLVKFVRVGHSRDRYIASFIVYPIQYIAGKGEVIFYKEITFKIKYTTDVRCEMWDVGCKQTIDYLIITAPEFVSSFERLEQWKRRKGLITKIVSTDSIYKIKNGNDDQEKIRNFIKDIYPEFVLLGGDEDVIPSRVAYAMTCGYGTEDEDSLHADLYYSDLDGSWDLNGNGIYGEVADSIDMLPDVYVGRAPINTVSDVDNFCDKVIKYEQGYSSDYLEDILFFAEVLWGNPYTDGGVHKDMIDDFWVPENFDITKLYERDGTERKDTVIAEINEGKNLINHDGHGLIGYMGTGDDGLLNSDIDALSNGNRLGILYSIGCWTGAFDYDCIGEHFINARNGGTVAYIGNSRYGWGSPGNPGYGYSDIFDNAFYKAIFADSLFECGKALAQSKAFYAPLSISESVYRWCQYCINLLGDPEMPIWTKIPEVLTVVYNDTIPQGDIDIHFIIKRGEYPIQNATISIGIDGEYKQAYTDRSGTAIIQISTSAGYLELTVTKHNFIPYIDSILVIADGSFVRYSSHSISEEPNPGDTLNIDISLKNFGTESSDSITAILKTADTLASVLDSIKNYRVIGPGDTVWRQFQFYIKESARNGHTIYFNIGLQVSLRGAKQRSNLKNIKGRDCFANARNDRKDFGSFGVVVKAPVIICGGLINQPLTVEPGDTISVEFIFHNRGLGAFKDGNLIVSSTDSYITMLDSTDLLGNILPDSTKTGTVYMAIAEDCPTPYFAELISTLWSERWTFIDTVLLGIGNFGFFDDLEAGDGNWSYDGEWGLTEYRSHSGNSSFYCGDTGDTTYSNNINDTLLSRTFVVGLNSILEFWHWFDMAGLEHDNGCDGLYIGIKTQDALMILDFIGSGGALDSSLSSVREWVSSSYNLGFLNAGDTVQIFFNFMSNASEVGEGWYIDDIRVYSPLSGVEEEGQNTNSQFSILNSQFLEIYPNPFSTKTTIQINVGANLCVRPDIGQTHRSAPTVLIYDLSGRLVRSFKLSTINYQLSTVMWDGTNDNGKKVKSGVYFCKLQVGDKVIVKKLIAIR